MTNPLSDTVIYKNTYHQLVCWVKELLDMRRTEETVYDRNLTQAKRIMELEFDLRKYSAMIIEDKQESVMTEFGTLESNVIPFEKTIRPKRGGGGPPSKDWLSGMEWGTQFYARQRGQSPNWLLVKFLMAGTRNKTVLLVPMAGTEDVVTDDRSWLAVDPKGFCAAWELFDEFPPMPIQLEEQDE